MDFDLSRFFDGFFGPESIAFLLLMLGAYLLGILTGYVSRGRKVRRLQAELKKKEDELEALQLEHTQLQEQFDLKEADLQKAKREVEDLYGRIGQVERERNQLRGDLQNLRQELEEERTSNEAYGATIEDLNNQIAGLRTRPETTTSPSDAGISEDMQNEMAQMQSFYLATRQKLEPMTEKLERLEDEVDYLQAELAKVKRTTYPTEVVVTDMDEEIVSAKAFITDVIGSRISMAEPEEKDDLTLINGIGSFIEKKLNEIGLYTYEQISQLDEAFIEKVTVAIDYFPGRIKRDNWVGQAERLHQMKLENPDAFNRTSGYPANPKDLKVIEGINPKVEEILKANGIRNWSELAGTDAERLQAMLREAGEEFAQHDPSTWPEQARLAASSEWQKLQEYQDYLIRGKE